MKSDYLSLATLNLLEFTSKIERFQKLFDHKFFKKHASRRDGYLCIFNAFSWYDDLTDDSNCWEELDCYETISRHKNKKPIFLKSPFKV